LRILYFDCFNGASGDMILGALLDAGLPLDALRQALGSLAIEDFDVSAERVLRAGISATKFRLVERTPAPVESPPTAASHGHSGHHHHHEHGHGHTHSHDQGPDHPHGPDGGGGHTHRNLPEIFAHIERSALSPGGRDRARALFARLAEAEAAIHQMPVERVHLHEVGALDSIVDIVGAVFALEWFGVDRVMASPLNVGRGMVRSAHGVFPVPAPATVRLLGDAPIFSRGPEAELLTPTGALVITDAADEFGPLPSMRVTAAGYGAGDRDFPETPNVLRVLVGEGGASRVHPVVVVECEIDDMNPQLYGPLMEALYDAGALEVFYAAVQMKKNRPGTMVTVLAPPDRREAVVGVLFRETTTIGVRYGERQRECLTREFATVKTAFGPVRIKVARREGAVSNAQPEFEDCAARAREHGVATKDVHAAAMKAWLETRPD
jgi:uncharacterized protein (TIGR00299 family) protein